MQKILKAAPNDQLIRLYKHFGVWDVEKLPSGIYDNAADSYYVLMSQADRNEHLSGEVALANYIIKIQEELLASGKKERVQTLQIGIIETIASVLPSDVNGVATYCGVCISLSRNEHTKGEFCFDYYCCSVVDPYNAQLMVQVRDTKLLLETISKRVAELLKVLFGRSNMRCYRTITASTPDIALGVSLYKVMDCMVNPDPSRSLSLTSQDLAITGMFRFGLVGQILDSHGVLADIPVNQYRLIPGLNGDDVPPKRKKVKIKGLVSKSVAPLAQTATSSDYSGVLNSHFQRQSPMSSFNFGGAGGSKVQMPYTLRDFQADLMSLVGQVSDQLRLTYEKQVLWMITHHQDMSQNLLHENRLEKLYHSLTIGRDEWQFLRSLFLSAQHIKDPTIRRELVMNMLNQHDTGLHPETTQRASM